METTRNIRFSNFSSLSTAVCAFAAALSSAPATAQHIDEEVVVVATPRGARVGDLAQSVTIVGADELDRVRAANLGETLESQLGMSASSFGAGASRPIIRGLGGARVRTLVDGIDSMDVATVSADHAVGVDPLVARQIEIFRGPTTLLYGGGAVGGIVNTVTGRMPEDLPDGTIDAAFEVSGNTVADERAAALLIDGGTERFAWHVDASTRDADDYEIPGFADLDHDPLAAPGVVGGVLENSAMTLSGYALGGSWLGDNALFGLTISGFDSEYGVPGHHEEATGPAQTHDEAVRIDLGQRRVDLRAELDLAPGSSIESVRIRAGRNDYEHVELEGSEVGTRFGNTAAEARVELLHAPFGQWTGAVGFQLAEREFVALGEEAFVPPVDTRTAGLFVVEELPLAAWTLSLGARIERQRHEPSGTGNPRSDNAASVSAAAVRDFANGLSLTFNVGSAERPPAAEELYSFGPHLATGTVELGDAAIGPENSRHLDVSLRRVVGERSWAVTAFATNYDDYIYLRDSGTVDPVEMLPVFVFTQRDARFTGIEAEFFTPVAEFRGGELDLRLFGDRVSGRLVDGDPLPRLPPRRLGARLEFHREALAVGLEAVRNAAQERLAPFETRTAGFTVVNFDLSRAFDRGGRVFTLFVRGTNLLDEEIRRHASLVKDIAPQPGRNLSVGLRGSF